MHTKRTYRARRRAARYGSRLGVVASRACGRRSSSRTPAAASREVARSVRHIISRRAVPPFSSTCLINVLRYLCRYLVLFGRLVSNPVRARFETHGAARRRRGQAIARPFEAVPDVDSFFEARGFSLHAAANRRLLDSIKQIYSFLYIHRMGSPLDKRPCGPNDHRRTCHGRDCPRALFEGVCETYDKNFQQQLTCHLVWSTLCTTTKSCKS
jgi:hypothetical protein